MTWKKSVLLLVTGISTLSASIAFAGGPDRRGPPLFMPYIYAEIGPGYSSVDWENFAAGLGGAGSGVFGGAGSSSTGNVEDGFTAGVDVGYRWARQLAVELGGVYLPQVKSTFGGARFKATSWIAYLALKGIWPVPFDPRAQAFIKAGASFRHTHVSPGFTPAGPKLNGGYWAPIFAFGLEYAIAKHWAARIQYMFQPGYGRGVASPPTNRVAVPNANLFTLAIQYRFFL